METVKILNPFIVTKIHTMIDQLTISLREINVKYQRRGLK